MAQQQLTMLGAPIKSFPYLAILGGQSNASPEHAIALRVQAKALGMGEYSVGQAWHGGTNLREWLGAEYGGTNEFFLNDFFNPEGSGVLQGLLENPIYAGQPIVLHWFQGENDGSGLDNPNLYASRLDVLLDRFAAECASIERPWYLVIYGIWHNISGPNGSFDIVRAAQQAAVDARANAIYVETSGNARPDGVHIADYNPLAAATLTALKAFLPTR